VTHRRGLEERPGRHRAILDEETWRDGVAGIRRRVRGVVQRSSRHRTYLLAGLLHCGKCGRRLHGQAATSRGKEWRYYRCRGCKASAVVADVVEGEVCERISKAVLPANIIELAREQLRERLALPRDDGKLRRRLAQRRERLGQLFAWGDLTEADYRRQRAEVERDLALLPDDDKLVLFDRQRGLMAGMAENVAAATPGAAAGAYPDARGASRTARPGTRSRPMDGPGSTLLQRCGSGAPGRARGAHRHTSWTRGWWPTPDGLALPFLQRVKCGAGLIIAGYSYRPSDLGALRREFVGHLGRRAARSP
jgi:hypothetical protein